MSRRIGNALIWAGCAMVNLANWLHDKANDVVLLGQELGGDQ